MMVIFSLMVLFFKCDKLLVMVNFLLTYLAELMMVIFSLMVLFFKCDKLLVMVNFLLSYLVCRPRDVFSCELWFILISDNGNNSISVFALFNFSRRRCFHYGYFFSSPKDISWWS